VLFLANVETHIRRRRTLSAIHELRSIAHIVDMHQLTKDPDQVLAEGAATASSPHRPMTRFELSRYLDYCAELLSLTSKVAALYVQDFQDPVVQARGWSLKVTGMVTRPLTLSYQDLQAVTPPPAPAPLVLASPPPHDAWAMLLDAPAVEKRPLALYEQLLEESL